MAGPTNPRPSPRRPVPQKPVARPPRPVAAPPVARAAAAVPVKPTARPPGPTRTASPRSFAPVSAEPSANWTGRVIACALICGSVLIAWQMSSASRPKRVTPVIAEAPEPQPAAKKKWDIPALSAPAASSAPLASTSQPIARDAGSARPLAPAMPPAKPAAAMAPLAMLVAPAPAMAEKPKPGIFTEPLILDVAAGKKAENISRGDLMLMTALMENKWSEYQGALRQALGVELKKSFGFAQPNAYDRFLGNPIFHRALLQNAFIDMLPENARGMIREATPVDREFFTWLITTPDALEEWLVNVRAEDTIKDALHTWAILASEDKDAREKYRNLAIACALVFDKEFKPEWNGERLEISASLRYDYYKKHDQKGDLATHLSKMSVADLVWVVCAPVPESELDWARKNVRLKQRAWGDAYGMVPYDMEKAVTGKQKKPYDSYIFSEILEKGGICGDRTYFGVNTARALGIPAAPLSGDGPLGGHAWMAWKADDHEWKTSGRIGGYGAGNTNSPQTGRGLSEMEFTRLSDRRANSESLVAKASRFVWLANLHTALGEKDNAANATEFAFAANRGSSEMWLAKLDYWKKTRRNDPVEDWKKFMAAWKREFPTDSEMLNVARKVEEEFIIPREDVKLAIQDMRHDAQKLDRQRPTDGPPLTAADIAETFHRQAAILQKTKDYAGIRAIYHTAFREHGEDAAAFKKMANDYFGLVKEDKAAVLDACREMDASYERFIETRTIGWFEVKSQNSCAEVVAQCWREAGEEAKADKLLKDAAKREKKSKRTAI